MRRVMEEYADYQASVDDGRGEEEKASQLSGRWKALYDAQSAETAAGRELAAALLVKTDRARTALLSELVAATVDMAKSATAAMAKSLAAPGAAAPRVNAEAPGVYPAVMKAQENIKARDLAAARAAFEGALTELGKSTCAPCAPALRSAAAEIWG